MKEVGGDRGVEWGTRGRGASRCSAQGAAQIKSYGPTRKTEKLTFTSCSGCLSDSDNNAALNFGTFGKQMWRWYSATSMALESICRNKRIAAFTLGTGSSFLIWFHSKMDCRLQSEIHGLRVTEAQHRSNLPRTPS